MVWRQVRNRELNETRFSFNLTLNFNQKIIPKPSCTWFAPIEDKILISTFDSIQLYSEQLQIHSQHAHNDIISSVKIHQDGGLFTTTSHDHTLQVWDPTTYQSIYTFRLHEPIYNQLLLSDCSIAVGRQMRICDLKTGACVQSIGGNMNISSVCAHPYNPYLIASAHWDSKLYLWDIRMTKKSVSEFKLVGSFASTIKFASHGSTIYAIDHMGKFGEYFVNGRVEKSVQLPIKRYQSFVEFVETVSGLYIPTINGSVQFFDHHRLLIGEKYDGHIGPAFMTMEHEGSLISGGKDGIVYWDYSLFREKQSVASDWID